MGQICNIPISVGVSGYIANVCLNGYRFQVMNTPSDNKPISIAILLRVVRGKNLLDCMGSVRGFVFEDQECEGGGQEIDGNKSDLM